MKKRVIGIVAAAVFAIGAVGAPVVAEPLPKVDICHFAGHDPVDFPTFGSGILEYVCSLGGGNVISVNANALRGHILNQF